MALWQDTRIHEGFCAPYLTYQNEANDANAKVRPKLSLNATLSSTADLKSIPLTYRCILVVGMMLYPCEAIYCANMSIALSLSVVDVATYLYAKYQQAEQHGQSLGKGADGYAAQYTY